MNDFKEGYDFFIKNVGGASGAIESGIYVDNVNSEINELIHNLNSLEGFATASNILKGDVAEFWHTGTFNIDASLKGSPDRVYVDRSHDFASADISSNFGKVFGLKYYADGQSSAKAQAISIFQRFKEYQSKGGTDSLEKFLKDRNFSTDSVLNDPIYSGQIRIIPRDQLEEATQWLERMIKTESTRRPEQVYRYEETLKLLKDRLENDKGVESIPLSKAEAEALARAAKEGNISAEDLGLTTEELMQYEYILQQSLKAGLTSATITLVLKIAPEIFKVIEHLIKQEKINKEELKLMGLSALSGAAEGFIRGSISAAITTSCKSGLLGETLKSIEPSVIGAVTVIAMNVLKNSCAVAMGKKTTRELSNELLRDMYVSTLALVGGGVSQSIIEIPVLGYMIGSFIGSIIGSFTYNVGYKSALTFCVDTGYTFFGLVEQDYELPKDIIEELGISVFNYESFNYKEFKTSSFLPKTFEPKGFTPQTINIVFLRRGVIGISRVGYV